MGYAALHHGRRRTMLFSVAALSMTLALAAPAIAAPAEQPAEPAATEDKGTEKCTDKADCPQLQIDIPTVQFSKITVNKHGEGANELTVIDVPWIAEYFTGIYAYAVSIAGALAAVMMMIGGFQYLTAGGDASRVSAAKKRIADALVGLVLSLGVYVVLYTVNPELVTFNALSIETIKRNEFALPNYAEDGNPTGGTAQNCQEAIAKAKAEKPCALVGGIGPPVPGRTVSCNYHFRDADYDYTKMHGVDTQGSWADPMLSPINGTLSVMLGVTSTPGNRGGNCVVIRSANGDVISLCHLKDFVQADGTAVKSGQKVSQGQQIGHVGGRCCQGEVPDESWKAYAGKWCKWGGTPCADPTKVEQCDCQPWRQSGNTTGPHVHITVSRSSPDNILSCLTF